MKKYVMFTLTAQLLVFFLSTILISTSASAAVTTLSPVEARRALNALGISYDAESYFKAVRQDDVNVVKLFHLAGTDIEFKKPYYQTTALYDAVEWGSYRVFRYLMERGANPNVVNAHQRYTPLVRAISHSQFDMVWELLRAGASAKQHRVGGFPTSALQYALLGSNPELVTELLKNGASVYERYFFDDTPLIWAVSSGHFENVKVLLKAGAPINDQNKSGETALLRSLCQD